MWPLISSSRISAAGGNSTKTPRAVSLRLLGSGDLLGHRLGGLDGTRPQEHHGTDRSDQAEDGSDAELQREAISEGGGGGSARGDLRVRVRGRERGEHRQAQGGTDEPGGVEDAGGQSAQGARDALHADDRRGHERESKPGSADRP